MFRNFTIDRCYIIAEIGGNFTRFEEAREMIDAAAATGADAVKLQTYRADTIASRAAIFDMENTGVVSQHELFKKYEIDGDLHKAVFDYADRRGLDWFSTPSHESDLAMLEALGVGAHKVGSDDAVNIPFLRSVARTRKPMIVSTGMCTMEEVRESVAAIRAEGVRELILLHAVTSYPTHPEHVNLGAMAAMMREFPDLAVGYSDHTIGTTACICAAAMGARVIEKHFTCDKNAPGPDHMLSADPHEMKAIVDAIRSFEVMRGDGAKHPAASEATTRINNRKSIVMARAATAGEPLTASHLAIKRPGYGIAPKHLEDVIGRRPRQALQADDVLTWEALQ
ncbi:N-acetylneuraminate synthase family protein [Bradyrhizobium sp.]|uniref:N-acetylneuraminate synthase family protein n=1 Tax=Bradyrhizobium sp. TaxID=376 RepID=UPI00260D018E|nr:N-acetylneuraminate synthase family protein [Bradyrhizobium sp.]